ncbi:hypothetical protein AB0I66_00820 [Streptomyces sp. NPDC050439]|uniref:hypothetical protein n=1 Tax=unclassified Streptomyces TaxID=2593676 RepID=UPI0034289CAC
MVSRTPPTTTETRAKNWAWSGFSIAVLLNLLVAIVDLGGLLWFALRTFVLIMFTAALLTYLVLRVQRSRITRQGGGEG